VGGANLPVLPGKGPAIIGPAIIGPAIIGLAIIGLAIVRLARSVASRVRPGPD
jgi:hypothetical protein